LFAWRAPTLQGGAAFAPVSRESALVLNNVFLVASCACVFVGTLYPLVLDAINGTKITVGPPYYALTFAPIFFALLLLVPFGPVLGWKRADLKAGWRALYPALGLAGVAAVAVLAIVSPRGLAVTGAFAVAAWLIGASLLDIRRRKGARASAFAAALAHAGLGISLLGVAGTTAWRSELLTVMAPGQTAIVGPYTLRFDGVTQEKGPNYVADRAHVALMDGGKVKAMLQPENRFYPAEGQDMSDTAIRTTGLRDLYLALGDDRGGGRFALRAYVSPLAPLIWLGGLVMALGGILSLWGRIRVKEAEPKPAAPAVALAAE
jgi:cytochrome c-type biogenesis protein CcmF